MADTKLTQLSENVSPVGSDLLYIVDDPGGTPASEKITLNNLLAQFLIASPSGRLTLESGVPISTTDQSAKTTLYFTPYNGNKIMLHGGSGWKLYSFDEISLSLSDYTANKNYDIWAYDSDGAVTLDSTVWTDDTTRATALALQDGVYVKSGDTTRRFLGTIRITASTGECEDSLKARYVSNLYNRFQRPFRIDALEFTASTGNYSPIAYNSNTTLGQGRVAFVACDVVEYSFTGQESVQDANSDWCGYGVALDAVTGDTTSWTSSVAANRRAISYTNTGIVSAGWHYLQKIFFSAANSSYGGVNRAESIGYVLG